MDGGMVVSSRVQEPVCMQLPFQPVSQGTRASAAGETEAGHPGRTVHDGTYDSRTRMHQGPWETLFLTIEGLVNSKTSMAECIVPPLVGAAVEGRYRMCLKPGSWAGLGTQGSGQHSPPPHTKPCIPSEEQQQGMGSQSRIVLKLDIIPTIGYNSHLLSSLSKRGK